MNLPAVRQESAKLSIPSEHEMMVYHTMAETAVSSKMYKGIGEKAGVMMIMLSARELGIPCMQALNGGLNIIQGKVEISARMMNALIRKAGHQITIKEISEDNCTLMGKRCDTGEMQTSSFSIEDAKRAGLVKPGGGWTKFPSDMCFARALSRLARQLFSDVIGIGYVEGEIRATESDPTPPEQVLEDSGAMITVESDSVQELTDLLVKFDKEDRFLVMEYIKVVMEHFGWTQHICIKKFLEEKSLIDKFTAWKNKRTIAQPEAING